MAEIKIRKKKPPTSINQFLGINEDSTGDTQLALGESPYCRNFRITENLKLRKREGYRALFDSIASKKIQGMWYGKLSGTYHFLFACNGKIYEHDLEDGTNTEIGTLTDAKTFFFYADDHVYILNGSQYKKWNGTALSDVEGYRPTLFIGTPPAGGGTFYEQANLLTGKKKQLFTGDGTATEYQLAETSIGSVDAVYVDGDLKTVTTHYTVNLTTGKVTFVTAPIAGVPDNVEIQWTKTNATDRNKIIKCMYSMFFGGANDTRIHLWGNPEYKNYRFTSGIPDDGSSTAEYFPINANTEVGSDEFAVTDIVRQYDRQIIYTEKGTFYSYYEIVNDEASFPVYPLNSAIGNVAPGQVKIIQNNPYSVYKGVYEWVATTVRDERNAQYISKKVQQSLADASLINAVTFDYEELQEYWLCVGDLVWIYNYRNGVWYQFDNVPATCFLSIDGEVYFGTSNGHIMKFEEGLKSDNGTAINAVYELSFYDFDAEWLKKFLNKSWISLKPERRTSVTIQYKTDKTNFGDPQIARYTMFDFADIVFSNFAFSTNINPQPFKLRIKAKKFVYIKFILSNNNIDESATILSFNFLARSGSEVK